MRRLLAAVLATILLCCFARAEEAAYPDGVYRGFYYSEGIEQVAVQFELKDGVFKSVILRSLTNRWGSLMDEDASEMQKEKLSHFTALCSHLVGREVAAINELYRPEDILAASGYVPSEHVPYEKLISALWDGINHRPFKLVDTSKLPEAEPYPDGMYTGIYRDDDGEQVVLEFTVVDSLIRQIRYLKLEYKGIDYLSPTAPREVADIAGQFQELIEYLVNKPINCVNDLYLPGSIAEDTDAASAATLRAPKVISAIWEGLNKSAYFTTD